MDAACKHGFTFEPLATNLRELPRAAACADSSAASATALDVGKTGIAPSSRVRQPRLEIAEAARVELGAPRLATGREPLADETPLCLVGEPTVELLDVEGLGQRRAALVGVALYRSTRLQPKPCVSCRS
jgi:hypothetical protein